MGIEQLLADYWPHIIAGSLYLNISLPFAGDIVESRLLVKNPGHFGFSNWMDYFTESYSSMFKGEKFFHNIVSDTAFRFAAAISYPIYYLMYFGTPEMRQEDFISHMKLHKSINNASASYPGALFS